MQTNDNEKKVKSFTIKRIIFVIILFAILGVAVFFRLNKKDEETLASEPVVDTILAGKGDIYSEVSVTGTVLPIDTLAVVCKVSNGGEVKKVYVKNGDYVNEGDPICEIDNQKQIDAMFIQYDTAQKAFERVEILYQRGDVSKQNYEQAKAQYDSAKLAYDTQVEFSTATATGDGYIENTNMTEGVGVDYKAVLCYITSEKGKEIQFGVTERAISGIKLGDNVVIEKSGKKYNAVITDRASLISSKTGLFDIKAKIVDSNDLAQGIMAKVTAIYDESLNTTIIPRSVVYYENEKPFIYALDNNSNVQVMPIVLGLETDEEVEVLDGIDEKTKIISTWNSDLVDGKKVKEIDSTKYEVIKKVGRNNNSIENRKMKKQFERKISTPSFSKKNDFEKLKDFEKTKFEPPYSRKYDRSKRASFSEVIPYEMRKKIEENVANEIKKDKNNDKKEFDNIFKESQIIETTINNIITNNDLNDNIEEKVVVSEIEEETIKVEENETTTVAIR